MKKYSTCLTLITLILAASLITGLSSRYSASASGNLNHLTTSVSSAAGSTTQQSLSLPNATIFALTTDNMIYALAPGSSSFVRVGRIPRANGNVIGFDYRVSNNSLVGLTDTGRLLTINLSSSSVSATQLSGLTTRFASGFQSLLDFNPVVDAIRLIGTDDLNYAVTSANGGVLNNTVVQTAVAYAAGDINAGVNPNVCAGSYTNNFVGTPNTIFYAIDHDLDTLVTIATKNATGSSNTGGGQLQTIGSIVDPAGNPINLNALVDIDIFTDANRNNSLIGINNQTLFTIDLNQINPNLTLGNTQKVVARSISLPASPRADSFIDIAIPPLAGVAPAPTPTPIQAPTPTPAPVVTTYQAENAVLQGGAKILTAFSGFTGTGYVDFLDTFAGGLARFTVNQTGTRTLTFRFANGTTTPRACLVTVNGQKVGSIVFPSTGSFTNWSMLSINANLGSTPGAQVQLVGATKVGAPNLDRLDVR